MNKAMKRIAALVLAGVMTISASMSAFAVGSPVSGNIGNNTSVKGTTTSKDGVEVHEVQSSSTKATVSSTVKLNGKTYNVDSIGTNTITQKKLKKVTFSVTGKTTFKKKVVKVKTAKKLKTVVITSSKGKLKAKNFNKSAFKGYKGKIVVKKKAMTKKEFNKLKKRLKKGGFKGKISYKK